MKARVVVVAVLAYAALLYYCWAPNRAPSASYVYTEPGDHLAVVNATAGGARFGGGVIETGTAPAWCKPALITYSQWLMS